MKNQRYELASRQLRKQHVEYAFPDGVEDMSKPAPEALEQLQVAIAALTKAAAAATVANMFGQLDSAMNAIEHAVGAQKGP